MKQTTQFYLEAFKRLRHEWSEEIPDQLAHSDDGQYKVRMAWFNCINLYSKTAIKSNFLDEKCSQKLYEFIEYQKQQEILGKIGKRTTQQDIDMGNETLDIFIAHLEDNNQNE
jgi:hypothetical protein